MNTSALVEALKTAADAVAVGHAPGTTWTGSTVLRTVTAEETGLEGDIELLYFQVKTGDETYWVDESGMDELTDEDMKLYI